MRDFGNTLVAIVAAAILLLTGCDEEKKVVGIEIESDGSVYLHTEISSQVSGYEVANFTGGTVLYDVKTVINNDDGTVTVIRKDGTSITAPRE